MKRTIALIFALALTLALALSAGAAGNPSVTVSATGTPVPGGELTFTVSVRGSDKVLAAMVAPTFDANVFELVSGEWLISAMMKDFEVSEGNGTALWSDATDINTNVLRFTLRVKAGATPGTASKVSCTFTVADQNDERVVYKNITGASVTVACNHSFTKKDLSDAFLKSKATCTSGAVYYYSCEKCGTKGSKTFTEGSPVSHDFSRKEQSSKYVAKAGDCQTIPEYYFSCAKCGAKGSETFKGSGYGSHQYRYPCDSQCSVCGEQRQAAHSFTAQGHSETEHWLACEHCGAEDTHAPHNFDSEPSEEHGRVCRTCGYEEAALEHVHQFPEGKWLCSEDGHWLLCQTCGQASETEAHELQPGESYCMHCHYHLSAEHEHAYGDDWKYDTEQHWHECACGNAAQQEPHSWGDPVVVKEATPEESGLLRHTCTVCGAVREEIITCLIVPEPVADNNAALIVSLCANGVLAVLLVVLLLLKHTRTENSGA